MMRHINTLIGTVVMNTPPEVSEELKQLVTKAFGLAINELRLTGSVVPFVITPESELGKVIKFHSTRGNEELNLNSNLSETLDFKKSVEMATAYIRETFYRNQDVCPCIPHLY